MECKDDVKIQSVTYHFSNSNMKNFMFVNDNSVCGMMFQSFVNYKPVSFADAASFSSTNDWNNSKGIFKIMEKIYRFLVNNSYEIYITISDLNL